MRSTKIIRYLSSFFKEKIIETFESDINPLLEVALINGRYQLNAGSVNYSFGPLHDAFRKYFVKDPPSLNDNSDILILGLGAGSVVRILKDELNLNPHITGVEVDVKVIIAARRHFALDSVTDLIVIVKDAFEYLKDSINKFDLIIIDLYIDDLVPPQFQSFEFTQILADHLKAGGKVVFNKLHQIGTDDSDIRILQSYFEKAFDKTEIVKVTVNKQCPNNFITGTNKRITKL